MNERMTVELERLEDLTKAANLLGLKVCWNAFLRSGWITNGVHHVATLHQRTPEAPYVVSDITGPRGGQLLRALVPITNEN